MLSEKTIEKLVAQRQIEDADLLALLKTDAFDEALFAAADKVRRQMYGDKVYIRGLIEFTNHCKNNCYYCGIRAGNQKVTRYRLSEEEVLSCCEEGYALGFRTFVLQGGEDPYFTDQRLCNMVSKIRKRFTDCAITLSVGERSRDSYQALFDAGANRYLLRHETASEAHYRKLHPKELRLQERKRCLLDLKEIGYQVGSGVMVGSPYQTATDLLSDIHFLQELNPDMIGIGPYLTHPDTPFREFENGSFVLTLRMVALMRLLFPHALIPSTTALATIRPDGRERGLQAGANVVMPNLSPKTVRKFYTLYDKKLHTLEEAAESLADLKKRVKKAGYRIVTDIGNVKK